MNPPQISIIAPAYNEEAGIAAFVAETCRLFDALEHPYELVIVDDGSSDRTAATLAGLRHECPRLRIISLDRNHGQSAALAAGVRAARGEIIVLTDSDMQNDLTDVEAILPLVDQDGDWDCVVGVRATRRDSWLRRLSSRIANFIGARITRQPFRDGGCGLKVCRAALLKRVTFFRGAHRFLGSLVRMEGGRVLEREVKHRPRAFGLSKYGSGLGRTFIALRDALGVRWLFDRHIRYNARELP